MKRIHALPEGAGHKSPSAAFASILVNVVTPTTREHETAAIRNDNYRVSWQSWRSVVRQRVSNLVFLKDTHWKAIY